MRVCFCSKSFEVCSALTLDMLDMAHVGLVGPYCIYVELTAVFSITFSGWFALVWWQYLTDSVLYYCTSISVSICQEDKTTIKNSFVLPLNLKNTVEN